MSAATVISVASDSGHNFSKITKPAITLIAGLGVKGDAHSGVTVKHRSRVARDPTQPNLRQVHLIHSELFDEVAGQGLEVYPGQMGENITTRGLDLLAMPQGTRLHLGADAVIEITGLRNPCSQIEKFQSGLLKACLDKDEQEISSENQALCRLSFKVVSFPKTIRIKLYCEGVSISL